MSSRPVTRRMASRSHTVARSSSKFQKTEKRKGKAPATSAGGALPSSPSSSPDCEAPVFIDIPSLNFDCRFLLPLHISTSIAAISQFHFHNGLVA